MYFCIMCVLVCVIAYWEIGAHKIISGADLLIPIKAIASWSFGEKLNNVQDSREFT